MTKHQDVAALAKQGQVTALVLTREERRRRLLLVIAEYRRQGMKIFDAPMGLENPDSIRVRATHTRHTAMQPAVNVLSRDGIVLEANAGGVQDALGLGSDEMHAVYCGCHSETATVLGNAVAHQLRKIVNGL